MHCRYVRSTRSPDETSRVSSPALLEPFSDLNAGKSYPHQIKLFNFMLTAHVARFGHPDGVDLTRFQLIAPYEANPRQWLRLPWINRYSGERYRISTTADTGGVGVARVQTYRDVLEDFLYHAEAKSAGPDGRPCHRQTLGLLQRRVVRSIPALTTHVGKESNKLEEVEAGIEHDPDEVWTEYRDPRRDPWETLVLPVLKQIPAKRLAVKTGLALRTVKAARNGHTKPHSQNRQVLTRAAAAFAREQLQEFGIQSPTDDLTYCATLLSL